MPKFKLIKIHFKKLLFNQKLNIKQKTIAKTSKTKNYYLTYHIKNDKKSYDILVLILNQKLLDLIGDEPGGVVNTIENKPQKETSAKNKNTILSISKQKTLFGKIVVITPNIPKKTKVIINMSNQNKKIENQKNSKHIGKHKENKDIKIKKEIQNKNPKKETFNPKEKQLNKVSTIKKMPKKKIKNITNINSPKPKYKLQKKKTNHVAVFSTFTAKLLFGLALAALTTKKIIHGVLLATPLAILNHRKSRKTNKKLVKKYR